MSDNRDETSEKLVVIVGPTASGKSDLAMRLAEHFGAEILCADSRTVYRGMDIGTAKPTPEDQTRVRHWGLDIVDPGMPFTAADYKNYASPAIADISGRGKLPVMVGGSGMYIDGVLYDYDFRPPAAPDLRAELEQLSIEQLQERVRALGLQLPENQRNPRHLMRVIESGEHGGQADRERGIRDNTLVMGVDMDIAELEHRIARRLEDMLAAGLVDEVLGLADKYGWEAQAMQSPGYREFRDYAQRGIALQDVQQQILKNSRAFAKRQKTWFRRNKSIQWLTTEDKLSEAVDLTTTFLDT